MIDNITGFTKDQLQSPNSTLVPDWDVLLETYHSIYTKTPPFTPSFSHVLGHQDSDVVYNDLSLVARLNVNADRSAERFQNE